MDSVGEVGRSEWMQHRERPFALRVMIEVGHGKDYRSRRALDRGLITEYGDEPEICGAFATRCARVAIDRAGPRYWAKVVRTGHYSVRVRRALQDNIGLVMSLHLMRDEAKVRGRVWFAEEKGERYARAIAEVLGVPVAQALPTEMFLFTPVVQIDIANVLDAGALRALETRPVFERLSEQIWCGVDAARGICVQT